MDFELAFKRPFKGMKNFWIGFLLGLIPLFGTWFILGYALKCAEKLGFKNPSWSPYGDTLIKGIMAWFIGVLYTLIALVIILPLAVGIFFAFLYQSGVAIVLLVTPFILILLLFGYIVPSAIVQYAKTGDFGKAFSGRVWRQAFTGRYFSAIVVASVVSFVLYTPVQVILSAGEFVLEGFGFLAYAAMLILIILVSTVFKMYTAVMTYTLLGQTYKK